MTSSDQPETKPPPRTGTKFVCHEDGTEWADLEGLGDTCGEGGLVQRRQWVSDPFYSRTASGPRV